MFGQGLTPLFSKCLMTHSQGCALASVDETENRCYILGNDNAVFGLERTLLFLVVLGTIGVHARSGCWQRPYEVSWGRKE